MRYGVAIAAHGPFVAVENGAVDDVGVFTPVPVRLVAFVLAFVAESGFVGPDVVAMPDRVNKEVSFCSVSIRYVVCLTSA
jgi:hypothetical protein